ncbi:MAG TPA: PKD domain-containing protein [Puia sp.]|nr:PKD domain-containing protein [Puia sp.]
MIRIQLVIVCCFLGITNLRAQLTAEFSGSPVTGCAPLVVKLADQSAGSPNYWSWGTSNGLISRLQNPVFIFSTPGTYSISLLVKDANGNFSSTSKTDYITVYPSPNPGFNSGQQVSCAPANVHFNDISTPGQGSIVSWQWDFGDGTSSSDQSPDHQYTNEGYYNVKLTVTNSGGCSSTIGYQRFIRVVPGVKPDFNWSQTSASCSAPFDITFSNQTSGPGHLTYTWDLGNGNSSTDVNPSTTYPANNPYTITLSASSDLRCSGSITKTVSFKGPTPVIIGPDSACLNTPASFSNGSIPAPVASFWDFGDGNTSNLFNPENTYTSSTNYTVTLTNTYAGCTSSATKTIKIIKNPGINFMADKTAGCQVPFKVNFTDQTPGATSWTWDFGDGSPVSHDKDPLHQYNSPGVYTVSQSVTTAAGCNTGVGSRFGYIQITSPSANLDAASLEGCTGIALNPTATIVAPDGIASYSWSAPGATPSSSASATPSFTYSTAGKYDLTLSFTTNGGCTFTQNYPQVVTIGDRVNPAFTPHNITTCPSPPITFISSSTPVDRWLWDFGDGDTSQVGPMITHKFRDTGYFDITLKVTNHGCSLSDKQVKTVYINGPVAGFSFKIDCGNRTHVDFYDTSKFAVGKDPTLYKWDFGDGNVVTSTTPIPQPHDYAALGKYTVQYIVSNAECTDTTSTDINLIALTPTFTVKPTDTCRYRPFKIQSTTDSTNLIQYTWQVGTAVYTTDTTSLKISAPDTGVHSIVLTVKDVSGCFYSSNPVNINITGPTAKFMPNGPGGCKNSPILFTDNSVQYRGDAISSRAFYFGDFSYSIYPPTSPPYSHQYTDTGTYNVGLIVKDTKGCTDTSLIQAAVKITAPTAGFFTNDTLYCPNVSIPFIDSSKGKGLTYSWDFGDGVKDATQNPTHTYTTNDQYYDVKLVITDNIGCSDSAIKTKYIHVEKPIASFDLEDSVGICFPLEALFTPTGKYYDSLYWDFGDGITSTLDTTSHFYNAYGPPPTYAYVAKLILQGTGGCRDSAMRNIYVYQPFNATQFTFTPLSACDSVSATFNIEPPPFTRFSIYFGDGAADSSGNKTPNHLYNLPSTYSPSLSLVDATGCIVPINNGSIKVLGATPFFSRTPKAFCDTATVAFQSIYPIPSNDGIVSLTWDFGDGSATITGTPTGAPDDPLLEQQHFYNKDGLLTATIKVNTNSCVEAYTDTIHVWQTPHPLITVDGPFCTGPIQFHGNLTTPDVDSVTWSWNFGSGGTSQAQNPRLNFPSGNFTAHLTTSVAFGCSDTVSQPVLINPLPEIKGPHVITTPVGIPVTLPFTYSPNITTYAWSPGTYLDCIDCANPVSTPTFNTTYVVKVTDANNCVSTDTILVKPVCSDENYFVPNTFSPNNDGVNDVFYPRGKGLYNIQSMRIFNRWGQLIFERKNFPANTASNGWDGTTNGGPASADAYVYIIEVICNNAQIIALHGDVTLVR